MKNYVPDAAFIILISAILASTHAKTPINKIKAPAECTQDEKKCIFYPANKTPHIYASPTGDKEYADPRNMTTFPYRDHYWNQWYADPRDLVANIGRIRIYQTWSTEVAFVNREDIVRYYDLKKVLSCWPIKQLTIDNGDAEEGTITFSPDGSGIVSNISGGIKRQVVHAWYVDGVFSVRPTEGKFYNSFNRGNGIEAAWGNYDAKDQKTIHRANWIMREPEYTVLFQNTPECSSGPKS